MNISSISPLSRSLSIGFSAQNSVGSFKTNNVNVPKRNVYQYKKMDSTFGKFEGSITDLEKTVLMDTVIIHHKQ